MASLILGVAGTALGPSLFGSGFSLLGLSVTGAQLGGALGAAAGMLIDDAIAPGRHYHRTGSRLSDVNVTASTEGAPIPKLFGRIRVSGQLIWATKFKETVTTAQKTSGGGKGSQSVTVSDTEYDYSISFAVALCEGAVTKIGRVWADGNLIDISQFTTRFYPGDETQSPDPLIEEIEGAGNTPAYRGLCYIVFEDMPLAEFGNRIPQLQFELIRSIASKNPDSLENRLRSVALIPGAGEFVYATQVVTEDDGEGGTIPENAHNAASTADMMASLDELQALAPNLGSASLVVGWFGNDLRAGEIQIRPGVEAAAKTTYPETWSVNGVARADAHVVSQFQGRPAYGGTPSDQTVVAAIQDLKSRGLNVMFCPFLFMDVPIGNALPDPYGGAAQAPYPWRGRITIDPATDKTGAATAQVANFFGNASPTDFSVDGTSVSWTGGVDWGWRRAVLHYAHLCAAAGGVDAFLIGSELRGLTQSRDGATSYPAVAALKALAAGVKSILGSDTKVGYAADWSEYNNHQTGDADGAVLFNLDPLWSDANIDFIGIDNYMPLSDWRDGTAHLDYDAQNGPTSIYDVDYLSGNIRGGEDYDWYYKTLADRDAQARTPIADGTCNKPWVWRAKDIWNWWSNAHYDRADGTQSAVSTGWVPQSKPIRITELGCPAVEKGANQPNVFVDPKSSESFLPHYSNGERDDLIQRRFLEAHLKFWSDDANNPASGIYSGRMVDTSNIAVWCWDARPFPFFPSRGDVWGDAENYRLGHWLNGRLGSVMLPDLVQSLCESAAFEAFDVSGLMGIVTGFAVTDTISPRDAIAPLALAYHFDGVESEGELRFVMRGQPNPLLLSQSELVPASGDPGFGFQLTRAQESDLPVASRISYIDAEADYRAGVAEARKLTGRSDRVAQSSLPLVMDQGQAIGIGERLLEDAWVMRESAAFALPPSQLALDPTDEVLLDAGGRTRRLRLTEIGDAGQRQIQAVATDPSVYEFISGPQRTPGANASLTVMGRPVVSFLDLPLLTGNEIPWAPHAAAFAKPWPGAVAILRSATDSNYALDTALRAEAVMGETIADFYSGPAWRWDSVNTLRIRLYSGTLSSLDDLSVLGGGNVLALENPDGQWEVLQFASAELTGLKLWSLTRLLRGQSGTEGAMRDPVPAGARVVLLNGAPRQLALKQNEYALAFNYLWGPKGKPLSDPAFQGASLQFAGLGLRPLSPVHVSGASQSNGDLVLSWIRRTRIGGDSWDQKEVPLGEDSEAYEVDIFNGADVVRTLGATAPQGLYTAAQQIADFGSAPSSFDIEVFQISATFGRGVGTRKTIHV